MLRLEEFKSLKIFKYPIGNRTETFWLVAQCRKHLAYRVPPLRLVGICNFFESNVYT
jgi:hypothetical protein